MARDINANNVIHIISALSDANASIVRGLSVPELTSATGLSRFVIGRILVRPEYGFAESEGRSDTGALTYYHDVTKMTAVTNVDNKIQPLQFDEEDKLRHLVHNLLSALKIADPTNNLVSEFNQPKANKNWFDWLLSEKQLADLGRKAKRDKKWQAKYLHEKHRDNLALKAYNMHSYMESLFNVVVRSGYDPDALFKAGVYLMLAGLNPDEWKDVEG